MLLPFECELDQRGAPRLNLRDDCFKEVAGERGITAFR
jgi:hypothetical protein